MRASSAAAPVLAGRLIQSGICPQMSGCVTRGCERGCARGRVERLSSACHHSASVCSRVSATCVSVSGAENAGGLAIAVLPLGLTYRYADLCGFRPRSTQRPYARGRHDKALRVRSARPRMERERAGARDSRWGINLLAAHSHAQVFREMVAVAAQNIIRIRCVLGRCSPPMMALNQPLHAAGIVAAAGEHAWPNSLLLTEAVKQLVHVVPRHHHCVNFDRLFEARVWHVLLYCSTMSIAMHLPCTPMHL